MNRDEYERLKEAEKAHLRKVRQLKQQLTQAKRQRRLTDALRDLDTSGLDAEFEESLRKVQEKNVTSEARFELAMDALDEAAEAERKRAEQARFEADRQKKEAADLVQQMKAQMLGDAEAHAEAQRPTGAEPGAGPATDAGPAKTIGPDDPAPDDPDAGTAEPDAQPPPKSIGRFRRRGE
ncbi:MAG: hypothetical protein R3362_04715 [Rhodothermales bacterium]|nr:hypothetical protein [Rhodothermales bacterium]